MQIPESSRNYATPEMVMMLDILGFGKTIAQFPNKEINTYIHNLECDFLN
ncbi:hypothetical protein [Nostoc sp. ChiQUE01b]|nr:hypothetical protein [Nostoc sp. ChiQUE01b]MDZ8257609.1 hypothetical protein [Nostoc sp. ChiQUE01b]